MLTAGTRLVGQTVTGRILNEFDEPVPFANVYVKQLATGTISDDEGSYTVNFRLDGEYDLVFSSLGYEARTISLRVGTDTLVYDVRLLTSGVELQEITVSASGRDPAYGIVREASRRRDEHRRAVATYRTEIYLKAVEEIDAAAPKPEPSAAVEPEGRPDPFAEPAGAAERALLDGLNMVEMKVRLNYAYPRHYKEERLAYSTYGDSRGLFLPVFSETDFDFYRNLVALPGIAAAPIISPLSGTAVLTYTFELESSDLEDGQLVYRIRVTPRKVGNSTVSGYLFINAESYTINRLEFDLPEGGLRFSDRFTINQRYRPLPDGDWVLAEQVFTYATEQGKKKTYRGSTTLSYSGYEPDYVFPDRFFGNEVAVTTAAAYARDSSYWNHGRTVALTADEQRMVHLRDSIHAVTSSEAYRDSMEALYNRVTLLELALDGVEFRDYRKKRSLYIGPVTDLVDFSPVGGWRLGPYVSRYRRYPNGQEFNVSGSVDIGLANLDVQGKLATWYRYDPFHLGDVSLWAGREFEAFNPNDAYLNQLKASNYYLKDKIEIGQQRELVNGLYIRTNLSLRDRRPITGYATGSLIDDIVVDEEPTVDFERYQALISDLALRWTPAQRYMREPNRKVVLGSKWPTFSLLYRRGWHGALSSDIRFDYVQLAAEQNLGFGALGNSSYRVQVGTFLNTDDLRFVDIRRFRDSDPVLYSDPLTTFQSLDAALATSDLFFELHHIHHFNGALVNNIPLVKKTGVRTVAGGGLLYLRENNFRYQEVFAGLERVFKIGARRRLRVGVYGVLADDSVGAPSMDYKVSFDLIDIWKKDWRF